MWLHDQHNSGLPFGSSTSTNPCKGKHDENITLYGSRFFFFQYREKSPRPQDVDGPCSGSVPISVSSLVCCERFFSS